MVLSVPEQVKANQLGRGAEPLHSLSDLVVELVREAEVVALGRDLLHHLVDDIFGVMAEEQRAVAQAVIDVFVAIDVPHAASCRVVDAELDAGAQPGIRTLAAGDAVLDAVEHLDRALDTVFSRQGHGA
jgi:hypothetical protein